jgi:hypothetical protein
MGTAAWKDEGLKQRQESQVCAAILMVTSEEFDIDGILMVGWLGLEI